MEKKRRKVIQSEGRQIIAKVYHFLKEEYKFTELYKEPNCDISHLRNVAKRTADATGVSLRTVQKILKEERELPSSSSEFPAPFKNRSKRANKVTVGGLIADVLRSTIRDFHLVQKQVPTLVKLSAVLKEKIGYDGCLATLRTLLKKMGYKWSKFDNNRKVLVERHDFQLWRYRYLKKINEYRAQGQPIVYTDECYVSTTQVRNNAQKEDQSTFSKTGYRYILIHAGTEDGFIENACLVYKPSSTSPNVSYENYVTWLDEQLLPNLPDRSVIILSSASHKAHNMRAEKSPTAQSDKADMQAWLASRNIQFDSNLHKIELYDIIKKHKSDFTTYKMDNHIRSRGFDVLRLPLEHPELNAIESIWEVLKNYIGVVEENTNSTEELIKQGIAQVTSEIWHNTCNSVIKKEIQYMKDYDTEFNLIRNVRDSEDDTESEESSYDSTS